jgi:hypothetical protein
MAAPHGWSVRDVLPENGNRGSRGGRGQAQGSFAAILVQVQDKSL